MLRRRFLIGVGATLVAAGCGSTPPTAPGPTPTPNPPAPPDPPPPPTPPSLKVTRILTFGDSMTAGTVSPALTLHALDAGLPQSYPYKLQTLLAARYTAQTLSVFNAGIAGNRASQDRSRLGRSINESAPEVVILMEGANDLNSIVGPSINAGVDATVAAMEDMVRDTT